MKTQDIDFDLIRPDTLTQPEHCALCCDTEKYFGRLNFKQPDTHDEQGRAVYNKWPVQFCPNHPDMGPVPLVPSHG